MVAEAVREESDETILTNVAVSGTGTAVQLRGAEFGGAGRVAYSPGGDAAIYAFSVGSGVEAQGDASGVRGTTANQVGYSRFTSTNPLRPACRSPGS